MAKKSAKKSAAKSAAAAAKKSEKKTVRVYLSRDYQSRADGKVYGPGFCDVPEGSAIASFATEPPEGYADSGASKA